MGVAFGGSDGEWWERSADSFSSLSKPQLERDWSSAPEGGSLRKALRSLNLAGITTGVEVRLVDFAGDGNFHYDLDLDAFHKYIEAAQRPTRVPVIRGDNARYLRNVTIGANSPHKPGDDDLPYDIADEVEGPRGARRTLPIENRYIFHVTKAPSSIARKIEAVIERAIDKQAPADDPLSSSSSSSSSSTAHHSRSKILHVPASEVDAVLKEDFKSTATSYTIYVLNVPKQRGMYLYYDEEDIEGSKDDDAKRHAARKSGKRAPRMPARCGFSVHAAHEHYMWVDLTAGPMELGPSTSGDGLVLRQNLPRLDNYVDRRNPNTVKSDELMPALATFVRTATDHLVTPPMDRYPVPFREEIEVALFVIHDHVGQDGSALRTGGGSGSNGKGHFDFDWNAIERTVRRLALPGQKVTTSTRELTFRDCEPCVAAYTHSLKSHTSDVVRRGLRTQVHQYVDSNELHLWLRHYLTELLGEGNDNNNDQNKNKNKNNKSKGKTVLPVFLLDLSRTSVLLLDRFHQALAFDDMVLAVRTRAGRPLTDFHCNHRPISLAPRDPTRAVLAAVLQSGWGIAPTHEAATIIVNPSTVGAPGMSRVGASVVVHPDYTFSASNTPFSVFAEAHRGVSFSQADAAPRNVLLTELSSVILAVRRMRRGFSFYGDALEEAFDAKEHALFVRRWNHLAEQITQATRYMSLHDFKLAIGYIAAANHDLAALESLARNAQRRMKTYVKYTSAPSHGIVLDAVFCFAVLVFALLWIYKKNLADRSKFKHH